MKKISQSKSIQEHIWKRIVRVVIHRDKKCRIYLLDPHKDVDHKKKRNTFQIGDRSYIYDPEHIHRNGNVKELHYHYGCALPFHFSNSNDKWYSQPQLNFADSSDLDAVLDWHFLENIFTDKSQTLITLLTVGAAVGGIILGFFLGGGF